MAKFEWFSLHRFFAMVSKEFVQMRRDRLTFAMMVGIPIIQLVLFGFAINSDPRHLPTALRLADDGPFVRAIIAAMRSSEYFDIVGATQDEAETQQLVDHGRVQFVLNIPSDFERQLLRGERPALLLEADAADPAAVGPAANAFRILAAAAVDRELRGGLSPLASGVSPFEIRVQQRFNPEAVTRYNIVPGLMGVVLTMTMVIVTALAVTRERERGTMENLLATPVRPLEVMLGKLVPYVLVGYVQMFFILLVAALLFRIPLVGSPVLLLLASLPFIAANLGVGLTFSTLARNQLQAMQMSFFFFLPSMILSGFMFPFRGMPYWAQRIGEILPLTHYLRIVRGILLKGNTLCDILPHLWPILVFLMVALGLGLLRYRRTLD
ncbi:MAG: mannose-1-phosphate guanyltransferase [Desulfuromonadales bacterium GWD2_61_12]|nr:MAG: mannose-1-phosphate guanyltransferase [Desulfuromonadales bacterium GWC2_61_20]OGR34455.1 MAG: mannose-1-phosphate guanyltransferase [Desulfuromonadales bacterium GWD2_61_12]HAD04239.1 mannose-1-phosphate guanyltransferase [Desulfuromonas sp.]HBT82192.1 mannose-1-phosphate guanyltransferase [Desulfuromonas sp.]